MYFFKKVNSFLNFFIFLFYFVLLFHFVLFLNKHKILHRANLICIKIVTVL